MGLDFVCSEQGMPFDPDQAEGTQRQLEFLLGLERFIEERVGTGPINLNECSGFADQRGSNQFIGDDFQYLATQLAGYHADDYLANIVENNCPANHRHPIVENRVQRSPNPSRGQLRNLEGEGHRLMERWFEGINASLEGINASLEGINASLEGGRPVGIEYDIGPFMHKSEGAYHHASVLIARRWHDGQCQYKLRNSWGESCEQYTSEIRQRCDSDEGAFWVTSDEIQETVYTTNRINP